MIKILVTAPRGNMDSLIIEAAEKREDIKVIGAVGAPGRDYIGEDVGIIAGLGHEIGALVYDDIEKVIDDCDLVVDFSTVELSMKVLKSCIEHSKALICGTTGFDELQNSKLKDAGKKIPIMKAANTSYVVNVLRKLIGDAAEMLGEKCKIEIIDMHSESKLDAPSGTAIEFAEEMALRAPDKTYKDIMFHSIRAGNTPSSHRIIFGCMGEKMEISHDAYDWRCYAEGACDAVMYMSGKAPGLYFMENVVGSI